MDKRVQVYQNQKFWMTQEVKQFLRRRNSVHKSVNKDLYRTARTNLERGTRDQSRLQEDWNTWTVKTGVKGVQHLTSLCSSAGTGSAPEGPHGGELNLDHEDH